MKSDKERGKRGWTEEEEDEEDWIEGMTAFFIITHICLTTLDPSVIFILQRRLRERSSSSSKSLSCGYISSPKTD